MAQEQTNSSWQDGIVSPQKATAAIAGPQTSASSPTPAPAATSNWQDGLVGRKPPANEPQYPLATPTGPTSIGPRDTSLWERVKSAFTEGIPQFSSRTVANPKYGQMSPVSPVDVMTPAEQERHPVISATAEAVPPVAGLLLGGPIGTAEAILTSDPVSGALMAGTGGLGTLPGAAGKIVPRLVSLGFSADMVHNAYERYGAFHDAMNRGDDNAAYYQLTHGIFSVLMAGMAGLHAGGFVGNAKESSQPLADEPAAAVEHGQQLTPAERAYVQTAIQANLQHAMDTGNHVKAADTVEAAREMLDATNARGNINEPGSERSEQRPIQQVPQDAAELEGQPARLGLGNGPEGARSDDASLGGAQVVRPDTGATGREGAASTGIEPGAEPQASGGPATYGQPVQLAALSAVSSLHEAETGQPLDLADNSGSIGNGSVMDRPPAISQLADRELANGGINVIRPNKDLGWLAKNLGGVIEQSRRFEAAYPDNPAAPLFRAIGTRIADATMALARTKADAIEAYRAGSRALVGDTVWKEQIVPMLGSPDITLDTMPDNVPDNVKQAYIWARNYLDADRVGRIEAKRKGMVNSGMTPDRAKELVPDDWGIQQGYYPHGWAGNWVVMKIVNGEYEPVENGWRQLTSDAAETKAQEYRAANPDVATAVWLDTATLPGKGFNDRAKLTALLSDLKEGSTLIFNGAHPDGILASLMDKAEAAVYGPKRPAQRSESHMLERESNLPGWLDSADNFERFISSSERYKVLAPLRPEFINLRNQIAQISNMTDIQRIGDMPRQNAYKGQFGNLMGRIDGAIETLEGYPTTFDANVRNMLQNHGYDPNMVDRAFSFTNSAEALLKLGFNPASAGLHLAQTVAATYPVLGEKWTGFGILHSYDSTYAALVHDLAIRPSSNLMDIDTFRAYRGGYLSRDITPLNIASAGYKALSDTGLWMFSKGIETARRVAAIGAYEKGLSEGMSPQGARDYARDVLIRTQFMYSPADAPLLLRAMPRPVTQFRNFTLKMGEYITGLRGMEIPRFLLAMGLIGYAGLPGLTALSSGIEKMTGYNPEDELKKFLPRASRGVLGMLGIDYTHNIGFADWLGPRAFDPQRLLGPAGSDALNLFKAGTAALQGPSRQGSQDISTALRNISPEARRLWDETQRTVSGNSALVDPRSNSVIIKNLTPGERLELAAGLTPIRVAEERDAHDRIRKEIEQHADKRGYFVDKIAWLQIELMRGDLSEQQRLDLVAESVSLAKMSTDYGVSQGLAKAVRDRAKEMFSERLQRDVRKAPKAVRPQAYQELQNYQQESQP